MTNVLLPLLPDEHQPFQWRRQRKAREEENNNKRTKRTNFYYKLLISCERWSPVIRCRLCAFLSLSLVFSFPFVAFPSSVAVFIDQTIVRFYFFFIVKCLFLFTSIGSPFSFAFAIVFWRDYCHAQVKSLDISHISFECLSCIFTSRSPFSTLF